MNCPLCQQPMKKTRWALTNNQKPGDEYKEYDSTTYHCETDDAWVNVEVPAGSTK
jgi:hypothetical protein